MIKRKLVDVHAVTTRPFRNAALGKSVKCAFGKMMDKMITTQTRCEEDRTADSA
jgi:hypothetical protein